MKKLQPSKLEVFKTICEIVDQDALDASASVVAIGEALVKIGQAIEGLSIEDARAVIKSVAILHGVR